MHNPTAKPELYTQLHKRGNNKAKLKSHHLDIVSMRQESARRKKAKLSARGQATVSKALQIDDYVLREIKPEALPSPKALNDWKENYFVGKKIYSKDVYEEYGSMQSVLKPRFKHLIHAANQLDSEN